MPDLNEAMRRQRELAEAPTLGNLHPDARAQAIARAGLADAERLQWLHSAQAVDAEGYEWGVFRVKWENGRAVDVQRTRADHSDIDAVRAPVSAAVAAPTGARTEGQDSVHPASGDRTVPTAVPLSEPCATDLSARPVQPLTDAARDVLAERQRQQEVERWTPDHDDNDHDGGDLSAAGAAYALAAADLLHPQSQGDGGFTMQNPPSMWPPEWHFKPADPRRMLVKATALLLAEIERLDRIAPPVAQPGQHTHADPRLEKAQRASDASFNAATGASQNE